MKDSAIVDRPAWLALLSPIPEHAVPERKPVASAEQIANGTDGPIAGWSSITVNLSDPGVGLRHVMVTLDASGKILAAGDHVMVAHEVLRDGVEFTISITKASAADTKTMGRFAARGGGRIWKDRRIRMSRASPVHAVAPTEEEIAALTRLVADVMARHKKMS